MSEDFSKYQPLAEKFVDFVNHSPTPYHAVDTARKALEANGFVRVNEASVWKLAAGGKYYFTRNESTIAAFAVGSKYEAPNGVVMVGCHTDSPNLRVKPVPDVEKEAFHQIEIEPYGGGLWTTWFDRDLTLAGRVLVKRGQSFETKLFSIKNSEVADYFACRPILRVPTLAIHLDRESGTKLEFNKQTQLFPLLATTIRSQLTEGGKEKPAFLSILANELKCEVDDIRDFDVSVLDAQPSCLGGLYNEFIFSGRLDNLMMSFCAVQALIAASCKEALANQKAVVAAVLFDHEEVGSCSAHGAQSPIASELIKRITEQFTKEDLYEVAVRKSFLVSADMAHAVHPNYADKHDPNHKPRIHKGVVIKRNANQRYATTIATAFHLKEVARNHNIPVQEFVVRNDSTCGSTIGPIISGATGIRTVDIGNPQLSMHSIREMCGVADTTHAVNLLTHLYNDFAEIDASLKTDC